MWRKLPVACFVQFHKLLSSLDPLSSLCSAWYGAVKEGLLRQNQISPLRRTGLEWVSNKGNQLHTTSVHTESIGQPLGSFAIDLGEA